MSMFKLYLLFSVAPSIAGLFMIFAVVQIIIIISGVFCEDLRDFIGKLSIKNKKYIKIFFVFFIASVLISVFVPDQDTLVKMYVANYVTTNGEIKQLPEVVIDYIKKETKLNEQ